MKTLQLLLMTLLLINVQTVFSQVDKSKNRNEKTNDSTKHWKTKLFLNFGVNGSLLFNWTAGGESNLSIQSIAKINADYKKNKIGFTNELDIIYGLATGHGDLLAKETDLIQLENEFNYNLGDKLHLSFLTHLTTQFSPGYIYTETDTDAEIKTKFSSFLSPGLANEAIGINLIDKFYEIGLAPIGMKQTIVIDPSIDSSIYGLSSGKVRNEVGTYLNANGNFKLIKGALSLDTDLIAFIPYNDFGKVDFLFKYLLDYKISKIFSINSSMFILYDDDIGRPKLIDSNNNGIPDTISKSNSNIQLKQVLSIGVNLSI